MADIPDSNADRHWNSRTSEGHRKMDRTQPISDGGSQNPVHNAERHQLHAEVDDVKDLAGNMGLEATVRSNLRNSLKIRMSIAFRYNDDDFDPCSVGADI